MDPQKLVNLPCPDCKKDYRVTHIAVDQNNHLVFVGTCKACNKTWGANLSAVLRKLGH